MTNPNYAHLHLLIDASGSMQNRIGDVTGSVNKLLQEQKSGVGQGTITLTTFNSYNTVTQLDFAPLNEDRVFNWFNADGMTPLYDAIGRSIVKLGNRLEAMPESERPGKVLFVIVTDGIENDSTEYTLQDVRDMIAHQTSVYGWEFVFTAAGLDAAAQGASVGIRSSYTVTADRAGIYNLMHEVSTAYSSSRQGGSGAGHFGTLGDQNT